MSTAAIAPFAPAPRTAAGQRTVTQRVAAPRPAAPEASRRRGFVLYVDLSTAEAAGSTADVLSIAQTLAELTREWLPDSRTRAVLTSPERPPELVPAGATASFREALAALPTTSEVVISVATRTVTVADRVARLSRKEFDLLLHLARNAERIITREELHESVWGSTQIESGSRTVDVHVRRLREKTGLDSLVATVRGSGYRISPAHSVLIRD